jgi:FtsZ-binding cell division protein ZapB
MPELIDEAIAAWICRAAADTIEAQAAEIEELKSWKAAEDAHHHAMRAEIERLREALREMFEAVCGETGFAQAVRAESGFAYPWPALDIAEAMARAALKEKSGE